MRHICGFDTSYMMISWIYSIVFAMDVCLVEDTSWMTLYMSSRMKLSPLYILEHHLQYLPTTVAFSNYRANHDVARLIFV